MTSDTIYRTKKNYTLIRYSTTSLWISIVTQDLFNTY